MQFPLKYYFSYMAQYPSLWVKVDKHLISVELWVFYAISAKFLVNWAQVPRGTGRKENMIFFLYFWTLN